MNYEILSYEVPLLVEELKNKSGKESYRIKKVSTNGIIIIYINLIWLFI